MMKKKALSPNYIPFLLLLFGTFSSRMEFAAVAMFRTETRHDVILDGLLQEIPAGLPVLAGYDETKGINGERNRIVGGETAIPNEFPWFAGLCADEKCSRFYCGGSLIHPSWVLSAAHCMTANPLTVVINATRHGTDHPGAIPIAVVEQVIHPNFRQDPSGVLVHDIMLLRLARPVPESIVPVAYNSEPSIPRVEAPVIAAGLGVIESLGSRYATELQKVQLNARQDGYCNEVFRGLLYPESMFCVGGSSDKQDMEEMVRMKCHGAGEDGGDDGEEEEVCINVLATDNFGRDACFGDSGGPLVNSEKNLLVGIVSFGSMCASEIPGVYSRVSSATNWIQSQLGTTMHGMARSVPGKTKTMSQSPPMPLTMLFPIPVALQPSSTVPTMVPSEVPSQFPTSIATVIPSRAPSQEPSNTATGRPSSLPTFWEVTESPAPLTSTEKMTLEPSRIPTGTPSQLPTFQPRSALPSEEPSSRPSGTPTFSPTRTLAPSWHPTEIASPGPSPPPTRMGPTLQPTERPTLRPSESPTTLEPSDFPTEVPSSSPSSTPTEKPTTAPSQLPTFRPSDIPTVAPSSRPTGLPTLDPSQYPSSNPTIEPSKLPTQGTTLQPTDRQTLNPSASPTTVRPAHSPTKAPTSEPSSLPTNPATSAPSQHPTFRPSAVPSGTPSSRPTQDPTLDPTWFPSAPPTTFPTQEPSLLPTDQPSWSPSGPLILEFFTNVPSNDPTSLPSADPTQSATRTPSEEPTFRPSESPTEAPSSRPSKTPTLVPSSSPTLHHTQPPSAEPSGLPTSVPSLRPTLRPTQTPTLNPTKIPTTPPSFSPTRKPTNAPSSFPSAGPTDVPTGAPSSQPSEAPTFLPSSPPSPQPTYFPTNDPTDSPSWEPSPFPSRTPNAAPTADPTQIRLLHPTLASALTNTTTSTASHCGCLPCTDEIWNREAPAGTGADFSCGRRIQWLTTQPGYPTEESACLRVVDEFPTICGPECHPSVCHASPVVDPEVVKFVLVDASSSKPIQTLETGDILSLDELPSELSILIETHPSIVGSVRIFWDRSGVEDPHIENLAPYSLIGDWEGDFDAVTFESGRHTIMATPFKMLDAEGEPGISKEVTFTVVTGLPW